MFHKFVKNGIIKILVAELLIRVKKYEELDLMISLKCELAAFSCAICFGEVGFQWVYPKCCYSLLVGSSIRF